MRCFRFAIFLGLILAWIFLPGDTLAHQTMKPHYLKADLEFAEFYPVKYNSVQTFELPKEIITKQFLVNQPINFEIDSSHLGYLKSINVQTDFIWDFGDGEKGQGLKNIHTYKESGSYTLKLDAQFDPKSAPTPLTTVLINVLPNKSYRLPVLEILANDSPIDQTIKKSFVLFTNPVEFNSKLVARGSSENLEYFWDFGDGQFSSEARPTHQYDSKHYSAFVTLRVKDENGLFRDTNIEIVNGTKPGNSTNQNNDGNSYLQETALITVTVILILIGLFLAKARLKK